MPVGSKVKQCLANLESAQADLESFALETNDQAAKQLYAQCAQQVKGAIEPLKQRVRQIEHEEPQYRGY